MYNLSCHIFSVKIPEAIKIYPLSSTCHVAILYWRNRKMKNQQLMFRMKTHSTAIASCMHKYFRTYEPSISSFKLILTICQFYTQTTQTAYFLLKGGKRGPIVDPARHMLRF